MYIYECIYQQLFVTGLELKLMITDSLLIIQAIIFSFNWLMSLNVFFVQPILQNPGIAVINHHIGEAETFLVYLFD